MSAFLLKAKLILQKTWENGNEKLGWDAALPDGLRDEIVKFFVEMFDLEDLEFPRSIWPDEEVDGDPDLIIFSDGSILAYGAVVYIRWRLKSGKW